MRTFGIFLIALFSSIFTYGQGTFNYTLELEPITINNLPGLHSYAFGQHDGKWLIIGGRLDGIHARQPFNAFPQSDNNIDLYVIDVEAGQFWSAPLSSLSTSIQEQLQATNMNFFQNEDTLYIIGGYAYSATAADHITFPNLTTILVPEVIDAIVNNTSFTSYFKQVTDQVFAVTGAQLSMLSDTLYLVGGHRFDGRYNPMGHATYTQTYTNQIRKFTIDNSGSGISYAYVDSITDAVHLRRRDYNLMPQIFPDGTEGFTISSGVFQQNVDLPFLYPVDITAAGHTPVTSFEQYLSNYHSASVALYDSSGNNMHSLFFGGMSRYYYSNDSLIQDDLVPFVKTISLVTRTADGSLTEYQLPVEMPGLKGASAEFIVNQELPHTNTEIVKLSSITDDTITVGHIYGGILSSSLNPFSNNQTSTETSADDNIYAVKLIRTEGTTGLMQIDGSNPYSMEVYPNPTEDGKLYINYEIRSLSDVDYYVTSVDGRVLTHGKWTSKAQGAHTDSLTIDPNLPAQMLYVTLVFEGKFFVTKAVQKQ